MDRQGCLRLFVTAVAAGELSVFIALFDLVLADVVSSTRSTPVGIMKVTALIAGCMAVPTAAGAFAYLAKSTRSVLMAMLVLIVHPIILVALLALR